MKLGVQAICLVVSCILFGLAAFNVGSPRFNLGWAGAFFLALAFLIG